MSTPDTAGAAHAPSLITEEEVLLGSAAALWSRPTIYRRLLAAIRVVGAARHRRAPRRRYSSHRAYLERSCMAREMDRL